MKQKIFLLVAGFVTGILNGLLGAGGGMVVVPLLKSKRVDLPVHKAHATAIAVIFPLAVLSTALYFLSGQSSLNAAWWYLPFGAAGAVLGALVMKKIKAALLRKLFAIFILYSAVRLLLG